MSFDLVLFGGTGDLAWRKLMPALFQAFRHGTLPEGGRIMVRGRAEAEQVCLEVADTGIGIPERDLPRIFERFYRVDKARSREIGGTGLGLSIVKHLTQAMRGTITAASQLGQGTTFTLRLPTAPPPPVR